MSCLQEIISQILAAKVFRFGAYFGHQNAQKSMVFAKKNQPEVAKALDTSAAAKSSQHRVAEKFSLARPAWGDSLVKAAVKKSLAKEIL